MGMTDFLVKPIATFMAAIVAVAICGIFFRMLLRPLTAYVDKWVNVSRTDIDNILLSPKALKAISLLATTFLIGIIFPELSYFYPGTHKAISIGCKVLNIGSVTYLLILETDGFCEILRRSDAQRSGVLVIRNIIKTVIYVVSALIAMSTILSRDVAYVVSALGAMAAVLLLVFKDSLLGMIAGIRLSVNGMLKEQDWIIVPKYNADGRVEDLSLTTVKVRNWDKSISTIPPHALMTEGFINKQKMLDIGVRQIKRTLYIDAGSVRILFPDEMTGLVEKVWIKNFDISQSAVNLSLFRRWLRHMMQTHPQVAESTDSVPMQVFVRELPATPNGLPLEIFFFVRCTDWEQFEELQADFIDEVMAALPRFGLRLFQTLTAMPSPSPA